MTDFGNQITTTQTSELFSDKTKMHESPKEHSHKNVEASTLFDTEVRGTIKATPHTYRRPSYMQYIEY